MKSLWQIHSRDRHAEFTRKNKVGNNTWVKSCGLIWTKMAKQFSVSSRGKFPCQYQVSRQADKQALGLEPFFLRILDTFHPFKLLFYWNILYFLFWTNVSWILNKYFWFLLKFGSTIFIYHGEAFRRHFFFAVASD